MDVMWGDDERQAPATEQAGQAAYALYRQGVAQSQGQEPQGGLDRLARQAQAGDYAARNELYITLEPWLRSLARPALRAARTCPSGRLALADVYQQIFPVFCDLLRDWQPARAPFAAYVGAVLPRRLRHFVRAARRPRELTGTLDATTSASADPVLVDEAESLAERALGLAPDPAEGYPDRELQARLLATLDAPARLLVQLHILEGRPMTEVAAVLGISPRTAWRLRGTALAALRRRLAQSAAA